MNFAMMLALVLLAGYGLMSLLLSILVAIICHMELDRKCSTSDEVFLLRLLPAGGAGLLTLTVVLPAFLIREPSHELESVGPIFVALALLALVTVGAGILRGWRACLATRSLLQDVAPAERWHLQDGGHVDLVNMPEPIVAVVGGWRPRIVAARQVFDVCSAVEFNQVIAHEAAHITARDNLKSLLFLLSPDVLAWLPAGRVLASRWRLKVEFEADQRATGTDVRKRIALAAALIKVARLAAGAGPTRPILGMHIAADDVEGRVRSLLAAPLIPRPTEHLLGFLAGALLLPILGVPGYGLVHQCIEVLVAFGR
jgi:Zn-dependent protease with chaperone function